MSMYTALHISRVALWACSVIALTVEVGKQLLHSRHALLAEHRGVQTTHPLQPPLRHRSTLAMRPSAPVSTVQWFWHQLPAVHTAPSKRCKGLFLTRFPKVSRNPFAGSLYSGGVNSRNRISDFTACKVHHDLPLHHHANCAIIRLRFEQISSTVAAVQITLRLQELMMRILPGCWTGSSRANWYAIKSCVLST
eukprot:1068420-Amphidinium_carterae.2